MIEFANHLNYFNTQLRQTLSALKGRYGRLQGTWQDDEERKFEAAFQPTVRQLEKFLEVSEGHPRYLKAKAQRLIDYQNQR